MVKNTSEEETVKYFDVSLSFEERAEDLVSKMTMAEKLAQMLNDAPAIPRLGIPEYNWWNEALHGVGRAGIATVFTQAIGMAATFNPDLIYEAARVISDEARAKHHEALRHGDRGIYKGLTIWSPNINIFRDPRWGRGHETYGEDPYLTGRMGVSFIKGLQGHDPKYLKTVATAKHAVAHSGPENGREAFDSKVSERDLRDTYLPAFRECIQEAKVESVMTAYNRLNGDPCSASHTVMEDILRNEFGFEGYMVSDCGAICNLHNHHKITETPLESAALAVNNGLDLNCGEGFKHLGAAVAAGLISEETIDKAVKRLFAARFKLGMFDPEEMVPFAAIPYEKNDCEEHRALALKVAQESLVLLRNRDKILPLSKDLKTIAVIGPNADNREVLLGNYNGTPSRYVTLLDGIRNKVSAGTKVYSTKGCDHSGFSTEGFSEALAMAERSDVVIMCLGLSPVMEGENGDAYNADAGGDKKSLDLPHIQQQLLEAVYATGKPVILVLVSGSALAVPWADEKLPAIIQTFYPGAEGGNALASVIFGEYSPSGRLPVTFYRTTEELPDFSDYSMKNRTYRYMQNEALYPFGYGLSYTSFEYGPVRASESRIVAGDSITLSVNVRNAGGMDSMEAVQLYLKDVEASVDVPKWQLKGIKKICLKRGEQAELSFTLNAEAMALTCTDGRTVIEPGVFEVFIGGSQPDSRSEQLTCKRVSKTVFEVMRPV